MTAIGPPVDDDIPRYWRELGLPGLVDVHVHFLPVRETPAALQAVVTSVNAACSNTWARRAWMIWSGVTGRVSFWSPKQLKAPTP